MLKTKSSATQVDNLPTKLSYPTEPKEYVHWLIRRLREYNKNAHRQIFTLIENVEIDRVHEIYLRTLEVEKAGGLLTMDGERRRTIGGVFFVLVREMLPPELVDDVFLYSWGTAHQQRRQQREQELNWSERSSIIACIQQQGTIDEMKVTLTGRPDEVIQNGSTVILQMTHTLDYKHVKYPIGTPEAVLPPMVCTIYLAEKMWKKVEPELANSDKKLTVNGVCHFDPETQTMAVIVEDARIEKVKASKVPATSPDKEAAQAPQFTKKPVTATEPAPKTKKPVEPKRAKQPALEVPAAKPLPSLKLPDNVPTDVAVKVQELHAAIGKFHEKIANLKAANQTAGIKMTERLLESTKQQLEKLLSPYK
jgi:hypothetical protein